MYGPPVKSSLNHRVISMMLPQLRQANRSVGGVGGERKFKAISGALGDELLHVFISDRFTAQRLVEL